MSSGRLRRLARLTNVLDGVGKVRNRRAAISYVTWSMPGDQTENAYDAPNLHASHENSPRRNDRWSKPSRHREGHHERAHPVGKSSAPETRSSYLVESHGTKPVLYKALRDEPGTCAFPGLGRAARLWRRSGRSIQARSPPLGPTPWLSHSEPRHATKVPECGVPGSLGPNGAEHDLPTSVRGCFWCRPARIADRLLWRPSFSLRRRQYRPWIRPVPTWTLPACKLSSMIRWYCFKCRFSSFRSFGGSQLGLVLLNTFSFSLLIGSGSIMMSLVRSGGSSSGLVAALDNFSVRDPDTDAPLFTAPAPWPPVAPA